MTRHPGSKINQLLKVWPNGTVAVLPWLEKRGAYQQLVHEYEKTAWLNRIGQGAYVKAGDKVLWTGGLYAIQEQLKLPVHAGAKTALQLQGYAHFLPIGKNVTISLSDHPMSNCQPGSGDIAGASKFVIRRPISLPAKRSKV